MGPLTKNLLQKSRENLLDTLIKSIFSDNYFLENQLRIYCSRHEVSL